MSAAVRTGKLGIGASDLVQKYTSTDHPTWAWAFKLGGPVWNWSVRELHVNVNGIKFMNEFSKKSVTVSIPTTQNHLFFLGFIQRIRMTFEKLFLVVKRAFSFVLSFGISTLYQMLPFSNSKSLQIAYRSWPIILWDLRRHKSFFLSRVIFCAFRDCVSSPTTSLFFLTVMVVRDSLRTLTILFFGMVKGRPDMPGTKGSTRDFSLVTWPQ